MNKSIRLTGDQYQILSINTMSKAKMSVGAQHIQG